MKKVLLITILFLVIGFSAVSTVLYMNGYIKIGFNDEDFNVVYSDAVLDGINIFDSAVSSDHKSITYNSSLLKSVGDISTLTYELYNTSNQYDANVSIECNGSNQYIYIYNSLDDFTLGAKENISGELTISLVKVSSEERDYNVTCTITSTATDRVELPVADLTSITLDAQGGSLATSNYKIELLSTYKNLPEPTKTGYGFIGWYDSLENGIIVTEDTIFTHQSPKTLYAKYEPGRFRIDFNADGGEVLTSSKSVVYDSTYGELPIATKEGNTFIGWYTSVTGGSLIRSNNTVLVTDNTTLYARYVPTTSMVISNSASDYVQVGTRKYTLNDHNDVVVLRMYSKDDKTIGGYAIAAKSEEDLSGSGNSTSAGLSIASYNVNGHQIYIGYMKTGFSIKGSDPVTAYINGTTYTVSTWYDETNDTLLEYLDAILYR